MPLRATAATDIAFAVGALALLGKHAPLSLKVMLVSVAIIDDMGAVAIIALFYTSSINLIALAGGVATAFDNPARRAFVVECDFEQAAFARLREQVGRRPDQGALERQVAAG